MSVVYEYAYTKVIFKFPDIVSVPRVCSHQTVLSILTYPSTVHIQHTQCPVPALSLHTRCRYKLYIWSQHHVRQRDTYYIVRSTMYLVMQHGEQTKSNTMPSYWIRQAERTNASNPGTFFFSFSFFLSFFFIPFILSSPFYSLSLLVVTQIRGHIAGFAPPLPAT